MPDLNRNDFRGEIPLGIRDFFDASGRPMGEGELVQKGRNAYQAVVEGCAYSAIFVETPTGKCWEVYRE